MAHLQTGCKVTAVIAVSSGFHVKRVIE
jgi:hypothetical protein